MARKPRIQVAALRAGDAVHVLGTENGQARRATPDLRRPLRDTPPPYDTNPSRTLAASGSAQRAVEEDALERAVSLGNLRPGGSR